MLTVKPIQTKEEQKKLALLCNVPFDYSSFAYRADEDDGLIGICQFTFENNVGYIKNLAYAPSRSDAEAMIIMLRAAMNFMFRCGIEKSCIPEGATVEELASLSGYKKGADGNLYIDLKLFYDSPCKYQGTK
ncbi:MAG: hypothetical protein ACI3XS_00580 [Eubacteriales bacterium]